ncbi:MAG: metal-dependent hydrolase [Nitrospirota bacterium]|nr:metal-dependent hydrolase [Nitrospirota bacterium]
MTMRGISLAFAALCAAAIQFATVGVASADGNTRITWHGHATFTITTPSGHVLAVDPWFHNPMNPKAANNADPLADIGRVDFILITHGHFDHTADAVELAKKTGARVVGSFELLSNMVKLLGLPENQIGFDTLINPGGRITLADGNVVLEMTPAIHSSGFKNPKAGENDPDMVYGGAPGGFVLHIKDGPTIYDTGDTAYFDDMKLIGECGCIDLALVNIGGHFGMEADMAARAVKAVGAKFAVAHHYGTFPVLTPNADGFKKAVGSRYLDMAPGQTIAFQGRKPVK